MVASYTALITFIKNKVISKFKPGTDFTKVSSETFINVD